MVVPDSECVAYSSDIIQQRPWAASPHAQGARLDLPLRCGVDHHCSDQLRLEVTACRHLPRRRSRSSLAILGEKTLMPAETGAGTLLIPSHTPAPRPAHMAAPAAVVSTSAGRSTSMLSRSACDWSSGSDILTPPSTRMALSAAPVSATIESTTSFAWWAMPSRTARDTCLRSCASVRPTSVPRASSRQCGASSPPKAGTKYSPCAWSTSAASSETSEAYRSMPRESRNQLIPTAQLATAPSRA
mmetsp:Transcript_15041/g.37588  ORF Transcript_15041/g.37588 Transcript_15041/m.37588 type:complete len:244 (+) Transcript_15041:41-772(+)